MKIASVLVLSLVLIVATTVGAKGPNPNPVGTRVEGVIQSIDVAAGEVDVAGTIVVIDEETIIKMKGKVIAIEDLQVGMTVAACGVMDGDILMADRFTVKYGGVIIPQETKRGGVDDPVKISPSTLLLNEEQGGCVVAHADVVYGLVDLSTVTLEGIAPTSTKADQRGDLVAYFDEAAIKAIVSAPSTTLTFSCVLSDGTPFVATDTVVVKE